MDFVALDVETANFFMHSICQIGIAEYSAGELISEWETLVNPEDDFSQINIDIHGITEEMVADAPTFTDIYEQLSMRLKDKVVVCHTHFDRVSLAQAFDYYELQPIDCTWLDSARVTRRTWEQFAKTGYGLKNVCNFLGYEFGHHDALEDAKAAAFIVLEASRKTGLDIDGWLDRVKQGISDTKYTVKQDGDEDGPLFGEVVVFTGELSCERKEAAKMAAQAGCDVTDGVNKKTTILVVGTQDKDRLAGYEKSSKHRKAEELISKGQDIKIIDEPGFWGLLQVNGIDFVHTAQKNRNSNSSDFREVKPYSGRKYRVEGARQFKFKVFKITPDTDWFNVRSAVFGAYTASYTKGLRFKLSRNNGGIIVQSFQGVDVGLLPDDLTSLVVNMLSSSPYSGVVFINIRDWENLTGEVFLAPGINKFDWTIE